MKKKINISHLICTIMIVLQLLWMQEDVFYQNANNLIVKIIYYVKYIGTAILFLYATYMIKRDREDKQYYYKYIQTFFISILLIVVVQLFATSLSSIFKEYGMKYLTRSASKILDKIAILLNIYSLGVICQSNLREVFTKAFIFNGLAILVISILKYGITENIKIIGDFIGITTSKATKFVEVHELTYCVGLLLIYYLFQYSEEKKQRFSIILLCIIFLLGGKRIGYVGLLVCILMKYFLNDKIFDKKSIIVLGSIGVIICNLYLGMLYNGKLINFLKKNNVDIMGRDIIYQYFLNKSDYSIKTLPLGIGAVSKYLENTTKEDMKNMVNVRGMHNDFLKVYLEYGFVFYQIWLVIFCIIIPLEILKKYDEKTAKIYFVLLVFSFITYLTDNTENYFVFQTTFYSLPLIVSSRNRYKGQIEYKKKREVYEDIKYNKFIGD